MDCLNKLVLLMLLMTAPAKGDGFHRIETSPGPEDFALDSSTGSPRLIISCDDRRGGKEGKGVIMQARLNARKAKPMKISGTGHPADFRPHGIALTQSNDGTTLLYVISHRKESKGDDILVYEVRGDTLMFRENLIHKAGAKKLNDANDLVALPDGRVFMTHNKGMARVFLDKVFRIPSGFLSAYHPESGWERIARGLRYANGVDVQAGRLLVSTSNGKKILEFPFAAVKGKRKRLAKAPYGLDNFQQLQGMSDHVQTLTGMVSGWKFMAYAKNPDKESPSVLYRIDTVTGEIHQARIPEGCKLNAASTVLEKNGRLYVGHVYDSFLTVITDYKWLPLSR